MTGEITLQIDKTLIEKTVEYARRRGLSLSRLVETYLDGLVREEPEEPKDELAGLLEGMRISSAIDKPQGVPGKELLRFAGIMDTQSVREIEEAVKAGCEQVDLSEW